MTEITPLLETNEYIDRVDDAITRLPKYISDDKLCKKKFILFLVQRINMAIDQLNGENNEEYERSLNDKFIGYSIQGMKNSPSDTQYERFNFFAKYYINELDNMIGWGWRKHLKCYVMENLDKTRDNLGHEKVTQNEYFERFDSYFKTETPEQYKKFLKVNKLSESIQFAKYFISALDTSNTYAHVCITTPKVLKTYSS